jgi:hypothetical protein
MDYLKVAFSMAKLNIEYYDQSNTGTIKTGLD